MSKATAAQMLPTLATARAGRSQRRFAVFVGTAFFAVTLALLPMAGRPMPPMPGFVPVYQSALVVVYGLTTFLFLTQYRRIRSLPLLILGTGSLYVTLVVIVQMLSFPNVLAQDRLVGDGPSTTTWLWTFWHLGPPLFALPYAVMEADRRPWLALPRRAGWIGLFAVAGTIAAVVATGLAATRYVHLLPKCVEGDDYWLLTTSGIGPGVVAVTGVALAVLWWKTRLRTVLQLWLAVSLLLLVFDNAVTLMGAARGTVGWFAGRMEALVAGFIMLGVYLREVDFLYAQAEAAAGEREERRAELHLARESLALALEAAEMGNWDLDLHRRTSRRSPGTTRSSATASRSRPGRSRPSSATSSRRTAMRSGRHSMRRAGAGALRSTAASGGPTTGGRARSRSGARSTATRPAGPAPWRASSWTPPGSARPRSV